MVRFPVLSAEEFKIFADIDSPAKVQDLLNRIPQNFDAGHRTCKSPLAVLRRNKSHCMEGAMLAAAIFWRHGGKPLVLDLRTTEKDDDHVVALFRQNGCWGAVSKTNHAVLRYRDPIYKNIRELVMSYFNEYFLDDGTKTLREYSAPFDLRRYGADWLTSSKDLWDVPYDLDRSRHFKILPPGGLKNLRLADEVEIKAGKLIEWEK
jgi:hypothetical protein